MIEIWLASVKKLQDDLKNGLVQSPSETIENYYERVGRIRGMELAMQEMLDLMSGAEEDE